MSNFKPVFAGYMKLFLHDDVPERLADRADFISNKHNNVL